jgi:hypothetical protein
VVLSFGAASCPYDDAVTESFFATIMVSSSVASHEHCK